jgi:putative addiction module component (TIGR02574 family)
MNRNEALRAAVLSLPVEERAELALDLVDSLDGPSDEGVAEAWDEEIEVRLAALRDGSAEVIPFTEALATARARLVAGRG